MVNGMRIINEVINTNLSRSVYCNNLVNGLWDYWRTLSNLCDNIMREVGEAYNELRLLENIEFSSDMVYLNLSKERFGKREGAPTELADIIIFVLDYCGDGYIPPLAGVGEPPDGYPSPIDINPKYLEFDSDSFLKKVKQLHSALLTSGKLSYLRPSFVFQSLVGNKIRDIVSELKMYDLKMQNNLGSFNDLKDDISKKLHEIIRLVLEFCYAYGIDIDSEVCKKIDYNGSRPFGYRRIGTPVPYDPGTVYTNLLGYPDNTITVARGQEMASEIIKYRLSIRDYLINERRKSK